MSSKTITCRNIGCLQLFNLYIQRLRHEKKYEYKPPPDTSTFQKLPNGKFKCKKCYQELEYRNNIRRHEKKACKGKWPIKETTHKCNECGKIFNYPCKLKRYEKTHTKKILKPNTNHTIVSKADDVDSAFIPCFVPLSNHKDVNYINPDDNLENPGSVHFSQSTCFDLSSNSDIAFTSSTVSLNLHDDLSALSLEDANKNKKIRRKPECWW